MWYRLIAPACPQPTRDMPRFGGGKGSEACSHLGNRLLMQQHTRNVKMTRQRRLGWSNRNIIFRNRPTPIHVLRQQNVQKTHRHRSLTNRHKSIRDDSCIINCEYSKRYKSAERGYCLYSGLGTASYCPQCCSHSACHTASC